MPSANTIFRILFRREGEQEIQAAQDDLADLGDEAERSGRALDDLAGLVPASIESIGSAAGAAIAVVAELNNQLDRMRETSAQAGQEFLETQRVADATGLTFGEASSLLQFGRTFDAPVSTLAAFFADVSAGTAPGADETERRRAEALAQIGLDLPTVAGGGRAGVQELLLGLGGTTREERALLEQAGFGQTDIQEVAAVGRVFQQARGFGGIQQIFPAAGTPEALIQAALIEGQRGAEEAAIARAEAGFGTTGDPVFDAVARVPFGRGLLGLSRDVVDVANRIPGVDLVRPGEQRVVVDIVQNTPAFNGQVRESWADGEVGPLYERPPGP